MVNVYVTDSVLYPLGWHCLVQLPSPSIRLHVDSVPDRPGEYFFGADYESRIITLTLTSGYLTSTTKPLARRDLAATFDPSFTQDFTYDGITYKVKYTQMMEVHDYPHNLQAIVPLKMVDPFGYSEQKSLTGSGIAVNAGNIETYPTFTLPPGTNPSITVGTTVLSYTGTIAAGSTLVIDCKNRTAYIGSTNVLSGLSGTFPVFPVGNNTVTVPAGTVTTWKDRFI